MILLFLNLTCYGILGFMETKLFFCADVDCVAATRSVGMDWRGRRRYCFVMTKAAEEFSFEQV